MALGRLCRHSSDSRNGPKQIRKRSQKSQNGRPPGEAEENTDSLRLRSGEREKAPEVGRAELSFLARVAGNGLPRRPCFSLLYLRAPLLTEGGSE